MVPPSRATFRVRPVSMGTRSTSRRRREPHPRGGRRWAGGAVGSLVVRVGSVMARSTTHGASHTCATGNPPCDQRVCKMHCRATVRPSSADVRGRLQRAWPTLASSPRPMPSVPRSDGNPPTSGSRRPLHPPGCEIRFTVRRWSARGALVVPGWSGTSVLPQTTRAFTVRPAPLSPGWWESSSPT
jgi:hypothetical protein